MPIQIPTTSLTAVPVVVPDHFKLADGLQLALNQLGDGFFSLKGTVTSGPLAGRTLKSLNGEAFPGTGLQVRVRDFVALIDGAVLGDKNKAQLNFETYETITVAVGTSYIVMKPAVIKGTDGMNRPDFSRGILSVQGDAPAIDSGAIIVARVVVPTGATQVTAAMIQTIEKPYLADLGLEREERRAQDAILAALVGAGSGGSDLAATINIAKTNFKVDTMLNVNNNDLFNGFIDVFNSTSDIDVAASDAGWSHNAGLKLINISSGSIAGIKGYWKMDEPDGSSVCLDELGLNNGSYPYGVRTAGKLGNAIDKPAGERGMILPAGILNLNTAPEWTVMCWAKGSEGGGPFLLGNVLDGARPDGYLYAAILGPADGQPANGIIGFPYGYSSALPANAFDGAFHHYAFTFLASRNTLLVYQDGVLAGEIAQPASFMGGASPIHFGEAGELYTGAGWNGSIDEAAILDRELTAGELLTITTNVNLTSAPPVPPIDVISNAHTAAAVPTDVMIVAEGTNDITLFASRDNGTTWTACTNNTMTSVAGQPSGTAVRYKVVLPALTSKLDNIALFWK